jgi:acetyl esterase/lipase
MSHELVDAVAARDPMLSVRGWSGKPVSHAGDLSTDHPLVSPIGGRFDGLGPMTIFVGTRDLLLPDSRRLRDLATEAGVRVDYHRPTDSSTSGRSCRSRGAKSQADHCLGTPGTS